MVLTVLAVNVEQRNTERALHNVTADAELVSELLLEPELPGGSAPALDAEARTRIDRSAERLIEEGRLVGLQLWDGAGQLLYSDTELPDPLSAEERALVATMLADGPLVEFEHDPGRGQATATVLLQPDDRADHPSGLVAEVLIPEADIAHDLAEASRQLYAGAGAVLMLIMALAAVGRRRLIRRDREARHDSLTGLGNRAMLTQAMRPRAKGTRAMVGPRQPTAQPTTIDALLLVDLDGFKKVNDTLGHAVGDQLLVRVGAALQAAVRPTDVVTRLGGDEFGILLRDLPDPAVALRVANSLIEVLQRPMPVEQVTLQVGASIGVALSPAHGTDLKALLRRADVAMYQAKRSGGGARLYDEADDPTDEGQLALMTQLPAAIEDGQLRLHYQPKQSLRTGRTVGFEALVRWQHPERGLLMPDEFLPSAERIVLMRPLTDWVLREATRQCVQWRVAGWDVHVAVNIAPGSLLDAEFPVQVNHVLAQEGLPGHALELEITETAVMVDPARAGHTLRRLRAIGVGVSIDDFGAGYTSLSYLKTLPVQSLKIDRGFVTYLLGDAQDEAVTRAVITLAHDLGLTVVAEGVETDGVRRRLLELGCDEAQGYLFARPMDADAVPGWLAGQVGAAPAVVSHAELGAPVR